VKILLSAYSFHPSIGGIEEVTDLLAREFVARGHAVKVVTMTTSSTPDLLPFEVIRRPTTRSLIHSIRWCDVYLQQQISLQLVWPILFLRRPLVVAQHAPLQSAGGVVARLKRWLKHFIIGRADHVIACSRALAAELGTNVGVIGNPYRDTVFRNLPDIPRSYDVVFLGRLVSDKGAALLLEALARLRDRRLEASLLVIGDGPEAEALQAQCKALALSQQVRFAGVARGEALTPLLNQSRIIVIPSIWEEPFGVVALEGIACGCVAIAARAGGLPEAVGPVGAIFPKGNPEGLADCLAALLRNDAEIARLRMNAADHLARHRPSVVADAYLAVLERV
jgi:glycogen(starch) synthase